MSNPSPRVRKSLLWVVFGFFVVLAGAMAVSELGAYNALPSQPTPITVDDLDKAALEWVELSDAVLACDLSVYSGDKEWVPLLAPGTQRMGYALLDGDLLCPALALPIRGRLVSRASQPQELRAFALQQDLQLSDRFVLQVRDVPSWRLRSGLTAAGLEALMVIGLLGWWWTRRHRRPLESGAATGESSSSAVPGHQIDLASLAEPVGEDELDHVLPAGALTLSDRAVSQGFRARFLGTPLLGLLGLSMVLAALHGTWDVASDHRLWSTGVEVAGEAKGTVTRYQGLVVGAEFQILYEDPTSTSSPPATLQAHGSFWTLFVGPGEQLGDIVVDPDHPERFVVGSEAELWGWRLSIPLFWTLLGLLSLLGARQTWKNADKLQRIASDPEEVRFFVRGVTEQRTNGVTTGFIVQGIVGEREYNLTLGAKLLPETLLMADAETVLAVRQREAPENIVLLHEDLHPFALRAAERARVQAVLRARGSSSSVILG